MKIVTILIIEEHSEKVKGLFISFSYWFITKATVKSVALKVVPDTEKYIYLNEALSNSTNIHACGNQSLDSLSW